MLCSCQGLLFREHHRLAQWVTFSLHSDSRKKSLAAGFHKWLQDGERTHFLWFERKIVDIRSDRITSQQMNGLPSLGCGSASLRIYFPLVWEKNSFHSFYHNTSPKSVFVHTRGHFNYCHWRDRVNRNSRVSGFRNPWDVITCDSNDFLYVEIRLWVALWISAIF